MTALNVPARRVATTFALAAGAALALSACSAGQITQTSSQVAAINGNSATSGDIALRNVHVVYPNSEEYSLKPGGKAALAFTAVNLSEHQADTLTGITTDYAGSVTITPAASGHKIAPQSSLGAGLTNDQAGTPATSATPQGANATELLSVELNDLKEGVRPGLTFPVTFTFQNAGPVKVDVPIDAGPKTERHESEKSPVEGEGGGH